PAIAALHGPRAEGRPAALAERAPGLGAHDPVDRQATPALEVHDRGLRQRTSDSVDGGVIEPDSLQCDLDCRDLGACGGWGGKDEQTSNCQCDPTGKDPADEHVSTFGEVSPNPQPMKGILRQDACTARSGGGAFAHG